MIPGLRPDLHALVGYHSAQVEAEVRLNTNESPYPPPAGWLEAMQQGLAELDVNRYPDRQATELRRALGELHGVGAEQIFCANGSNEALQCLLLAYGGPDRPVALFEPTYALHSHIAALTGTPVVAGQRGPDFLVEAGEASQLIEAAAPVITFLCSPNNPTGRAEPRPLVEAVLGAALGLVVVDEAYGQFASWSALELRAAPGGAPALVVVRTFSKTWAMAGVRLGYLVADPEVVAACEQTALPYHLSATTQLAGQLALQFTGDMEQRVALIAEERGRLAAALGQLDVDSWPSDANFILFRPRSAEATQVWAQLLEHSVLIRDCSSWQGLDGCLRVTVGTPQENDRFLDALKESL